MKIALVNTMTPFVRGGAEILVDDLRNQLAARGHQITLFRLPFPNDFSVGLLSLVLSAKLMDFSSYDQVIAFKFPAYCVCHRHKKLWMFHQFRQVYDLFGAEDGLQVNHETKALQQIITEIDNTDIGEAEHVFVNAQEVANRLMRFNGICSEVLTPPLLNLVRYHEGESGDYIYYPSRVTSLKRQHLAIEAMQYVKTDVKLILAGRCAEPEYEETLRKLIREKRLEERVFYKNIWVEDEEKLEKLSQCLAVLYIPFLEDSCGFVTFEGFYSAKPVISCIDSGGTKEFITDGVTGYLTEPTPQALARRMDELFLDREKAIRMGKEAKKQVTAADLTWDKTIGSLLA